MKVEQFCKIHGASVRLHLTPHPLLHPRQLFTPAPIFLRRCGASKKVADQPGGEAAPEPQAQAATGTDTTQQQQQQQPPQQAQQAQQVQQPADTSVAGGGSNPGPAPEYYKVVINPNPAGSSELVDVHTVDGANRAS